MKLQELISRLKEEFMVKDWELLVEQQDEDMLEAKLLIYLKRQNNYQLALFKDLPIEIIETAILTREYFLVLGEEIKLDNDQTLIDELLTAFHISKDELEEVETERVMKVISEMKTNTSFWNLPYSAVHLVVNLSEELFAEYYTLLFKELCNDSYSPLPEFKRLTSTITCLPFDAVIEFVQNLAEKEDDSATVYASHDELSITVGPFFPSENYDVVQMNYESIEVANEADIEEYTAVKEDFFFKYVFDVIWQHFSKDSSLRVMFYWDGNDEKADLVAEKIIQLLEEGHRLFALRIGDDIVLDFEDIEDVDDIDQVSTLDIGQIEKIKHIALLAKELGLDTQEAWTFFLKSIVSKVDEQVYERI